MKLAKRIKRSLERDCKLAYRENQFCSHIPDKLKLRLYNMEEFSKYDGGKPKHSLLPAGIMNGVLEVMAFGVNKYERDNWRKCNNMSRYYDACYRHLEQFWGGEDLDKESELHHIDHALCNLVFLKWLIENKEKSDDRYREDREVSEEANKERVPNARIRGRFKRDKGSDGD